METKDKSIVGLDSIPYNTRPKLLFIGNGINRCFDGDSWETLIKKHIVDKSLSYEEISKIPFPLQIVLATNDQVDKSMKTIAAEMVRQDYAPEETEMYKSLLALPFSDIITTNYTYELEATLCDISGGITKNRWLKFTKAATKDKKDNETNWLYRYSCCADKRIWHIHGEIAKPNHMIMGHYYYSKLSACIQEYIPSLMKRYRHSQNNRAAFCPQSWVDKFMLSDVYMLGFGMDMAEADIWYMVCCKKRNFPNTNTYFYTPEQDGRAELSKVNKMLMESYGVAVIPEKAPEKDYKLYYKACIDKLSKIDF